MLIQSSGQVFFTLQLHITFTMQRVQKVDSLNLDVKIKQVWNEKPSSKHRRWINLTIREKSANGLRSGSPQKPSSSDNTCLWQIYGEGGYINIIWILKSNTSFPPCSEVGFLDIFPLSVSQLSPKGATLPAIYCLWMVSIKLFLYISWFFKCWDATSTIAHMVIWKLNKKFE